MINPAPLEWIALNTLFRLALLALFMPLAGCDDGSTWHQKITVSVSTPEGIKTTSSVMKAGIAAKGGWWAPQEATGVITYLSGEAVVLEVARGRYLFALLKDTPLAYEVFYPDEAPLEAAGKLPSLRKARELQPSQYPLLVTFEDIANPTSVKRVDPNRLETTFGSGNMLSSITIAVTKEPVSEGRVEQVLTWLDWPRDELLAWGGGMNPVSYKEGALTIFLGKRDFTTFD
jgi:hypothetical protein